ncbi:MAG: DUF2207 domain-containing protein [Chromatiales bacterium]|nr:DUF2207 domain-containing protein [Chromatiales bacterium]
MAVLSLSRPWLIHTLAACVVTLLAVTSAAASERILDFQAEIRVAPDATVEVTETIRVVAEGDQIKRGIYRDFPTLYRDRAGNRHRVGFEVLEVLRDGRPDGWHQQSLDNGMRTYIGRKDHRLAPGEYVYTIRYRTDRQIGYFDRHDELYWNVTGNGWVFPIERASATVWLPTSVPSDAVGAEGYTGAQGAQGQDYQARLELDGSVRFETTAALAPRAGLTIVVTWPKGFVHEPTSSERLAWFFTDNAVLAVGLAGIAVLLVYYTLAWLRVGRDPAAGVVMPLYEPPPGYSPGAMRFVRRMGFDDKTMVAALLNLAVGGHIEITEKGGEYRVSKTSGGGAGKRGPGESALQKALFASGSSLTLERAQRERVRKAVEAQKLALAAHYEKRYFATNAGWTALGVAVSVLTLAVTALLAYDQLPEAALFLVVWLTGWTFGVLMLLTQVARAWRAANGILSAIGALGITAFSIPFVGAELFVGYQLVDMGAGALGLLLLVLVGINFAFYHWMKAPTLLGRKLLDQIEGFREYLSVAEKDEIRLAARAPEKTPELYERYLPYAVALDVEAEWSERFAKVIADAVREGRYRHPGWYHGSHFSSRDLAGFAGGVAAGMAGAVAAASVSPGSSSGSGGGGSSGGGGGGGGGGGW